MDYKPDPELIRARIASNSHSILALGEEIDFLRTQLSTMDVPLRFDAKWEEMYTFLMNMLGVHYKYISTTVPTLRNCKVTVRIDQTKINSYTWELVLPKEDIGGPHWKIIPLTDTHIYFSSKKQNLMFIDYLVEKEYIHKFIVLTSPPHD